MERVYGIRILQNMPGVRIGGYVDLANGIITPEEPWLTWAMEGHKKDGKLICEIVEEKPKEEGKEKKEEE